MKLFLLALFLGVSGVMGSCPNDCNGNGNCNIYSACECYRNWMGADCSERVCYFGVAFIDTPQGDLNADGFVSDSTYKTRFANNPQHEIYPTYAGWGSVNYKWGGITSNVNQVTTTVGNSQGEAHFYGECAAKGDCDRSSGLCKCFPGYEGAGCTRIACPNECGGHGICRTVHENKRAGATTVSDKYEYSAWDNTVSQTCTCDNGYFGLDCSLRECPKGDDPVTKYHGYTRIKFKSTTSSTNHDLPNYASATDTAANEWGFTPRIWSAQTATGSTDLYGNALQWSPWYSVAGAVPLQGGNNLCTHQDKWMCENRGVVFAASAAAYNFDMVVTGSVSGARGVQRRTVLGTQATNSAVLGPGCCSSPTDCSGCDFWSLYLSDVEGEFMTGDRIQITWGNVAMVLGNYIDTVDTFYNKALVQREEEQVIKIKFQSSANTNSRFQGYFSLTFTDEYGDAYTTEAIQVSAGAIADTSYDRTLVGDFYATKATPAADPFSQSAANMGPMDIAGGTRVAAQIEAALEALPGKPTGDVQVDFAHHIMDDGDMSGAYQFMRFFVVRFVEASGNLPEMTVNYAFTDKGNLYTNQGCGSAGSVAKIVVTNDGDGSCGAQIVVFQAGICEVQPEAYAVGVGTAMIKQIVVTNPGSGCTAVPTIAFVGTGCANLAAKAIMNSDNTLPGALGTCMGIPNNLFVQARSNPNFNTYATVVQSETISADPAAFVVGFESVWQRSGQAWTIGVRGTTENTECSNRGVCDYQTGTCGCFQGFTTKDCSVQNTLASSA